MVFPLSLHKCPYAICDYRETASTEKKVSRNASLSGSIRAHCWVTKINCLIKRIKEQKKDRGVIAMKYSTRNKLPGDKSEVNKISIVSWDSSFKVSIFFLNNFIKYIFTIFSWMWKHYKRGKKKKGCQINCCKMFVNSVMKQVFLSRTISFWISGEMVAVPFWIFPSLNCYQHFYWHLVHLLNKKLKIIIIHNLPKIVLMFQ